MINHLLPQVVLTSSGMLKLVARECILLEVLQRQKLVTAEGAIFTSFSTESVEGVLAISLSAL